MRSLLIFTVTIALSIFLCSKDIAAAQDKYEPPIIRIAVIKDADYVTLAVKGRHKILSLYTHQLLSESSRLKEIRVAPTVSGLLLGEEHFKIFAVRVEPAKDASIFINNRRFRGSVDIIRTEGLKLLIINYVGVENYLRGVLYHEVSPRWTMDALKAQAIVARTFALYESRVRKNEDYDVTSDVYSQVYGGRTSEKWRTDKAVNYTRGKVLTYEGDIFPTYYHAACGGHTEDASRLWNINIKPLKGVECNYCEKAPHYKWHRSILLNEIKEKLNKRDHKIEDISSISIDGRDKSGRVINVVLRGKNSTLKIPSNKFRLIIGPNIIRSTNFEVTLIDDTARFEGLGWGHGVGMCQWGSYLMSRKGIDSEEVLKFYYPGSEIKDIKNLKFNYETGRF